MPTLTNEQALESIFSPEPFGSKELQLTEFEKQILLELFTFNAFDSVYVYDDKYETDRFCQNGATDATFTHYHLNNTGMEFDENYYKVDVTHVLGDVKIGNKSGNLEFRDKPGFKFNQEESMETRDSHAGMMVKNELIVTMVHRVIRTEAGYEPMQRMELHVCLPAL